MIIKMVLEPNIWALAITRIRVFQGTTDVTTSGTLTANRTPLYGTTANLLTSMYEICWYAESDAPLELVWDAPSVSDAAYTLEFSCPYPNNHLYSYNSYGTGKFSQFGYLKYVYSNAPMVANYGVAFYSHVQSRKHIPELNIENYHNYGRIDFHKGSTVKSSPARSGGEYMIFGDAYIKENMTPIERVVKIFDEPDGRCVWAGPTDKLGKFTAWNLSEAPKTAICYEHTGEFRSLVFDNVMPRKMTDRELSEHQFKTYNF